MTHAKDAGKEDERSLGPPDAKTPFERFSNFAKRLIAVPKSELEKQERAYQRRRQSRKPGRI